MKARIYQMIVELDMGNLMYRDFETVYKVSGGRIPEELYECVYEGEFDAPCLEKLFYIGVFPRSLLKQKLNSGSTCSIYGVHDSKILEVVEEWLRRNHWIVEKI